MLFLHKLNCNRVDRHESTNWPRLCDSTRIHHLSYCNAQKKPHSDFWFPRATKYMSYEKSNHCNLCPHFGTIQVYHWQNCSLSRISMKTIKSTWRGTLPSPKNRPLRRWTGSFWNNIFTSLISSIYCILIIDVDVLYCYSTVLEMRTKHKY